MLSNHRRPNHRRPNHRRPGPGRGTGLILDAAEAHLPHSGSVREAGGRAGGLAEIGLDAAAFLFLPLLALVPHAAAPLVAFAGLMALARALPADPEALRRIRVRAALCVGILVWGTLSASWAIEPGRSLLIAVRLAGLFAA